MHQLVVILIFVPICGALALESVFETPNGWRIEYGDAILQDPHNSVHVHFTENSSTFFVSTTDSSTDFISPTNVYKVTKVGHSGGRLRDLKSNKTEWAVKSITYTGSRSQLPKEKIQSFYDDTNVFVTDEGRKITYDLSAEKIDAFRLNHGNVNQLEIIFKKKNKWMFWHNRYEKTLTIFTKITPTHGRTLTGVTKVCCKGEDGDRYKGMLLVMKERQQDVAGKNSTGHSGLIGVLTVLVLGPRSIVKEVSLLTNVKTFHVFGKFLMVVQNTEAGGHKLVIAVIRKKSSKIVFNDVFFTDDEPKLDFLPLDVTEDMITICVSYQGFGTGLYISQKRGSVREPFLFRLSVRDVLFVNPIGNFKDTWLSDHAENSFADVHFVSGSRGVIVASQLVNKLDREQSRTLSPKHIQTIVSYDHGWSWKKLMVDNSGSSKNSTPLYLDLSLSKLYNNEDIVGLVDDPNAPGLIVSSGVIMQKIENNLEAAGIFLSRNGGIVWRRIFKERLLVIEGQGGQTMLAARQCMQGRTDFVYVSSDYGTTWWRQKIFREELCIHRLIKTARQSTVDLFLVVASNPDSLTWNLKIIELVPTSPNTCKTELYKPWPSPSPQNDHFCVRGLKLISRRPLRTVSCLANHNYTLPSSFNKRKLKGKQLNQEETPSASGDGDVERFEEIDADNIQFFQNESEYGEDYDSHHKEETGTYDGQRFRDKKVDPYYENVNVFFVNCYCKLEDFYCDREACADFSVILSQNLPSNLLHGGMKYKGYVTNLVQDALQKFGYRKFPANKCIVDSIDHSVRDYRVSVGCRTHPVLLLILAVATSISLFFT